MQAPKGIFRKQNKIFKNISWCNRKFNYCCMFGKRKTILKNCAIEPEIKDLINFLKKWDVILNGLEKEQ